MTAALTSGELETYRQRGYVGPFRAFEPGEMAEAYRIIVGRVLTTPSPHSVVHRARHLDSRTVCALSRAPAILGRIGSLLGPDLMLWATHLFHKAPGPPGQPEVPLTPGLVRLAPGAHGDGVGLAGAHAGHAGERLPGGDPRLPPPPGASRADEGCPLQHRLRRPARRLTRPITPTTGRVRVEGRVVSQGRQIISCEASVRDRDGRVLAHGTSTLMVLSAKPS